MGDQKGYGTCPFCGSLSEDLLEAPGGMRVCHDCLDFAELLTTARDNGLSSSQIKKAMTDASRREAMKEANTDNVIHFVWNPQRSSTSDCGKILRTDANAASNVATFIQLIDRGARVCPDCADTFGPAPK